MGAGILVTEMLVVLVGTVFLLHRYGDWRKQHPVISVSVLVGWYFAFLLVFILPMDVSITFYRSRCAPDPSTTHAASNASETNATTTPAPVNYACVPPASLVSKDVLLYLWRVVYWTSQALTWLILPVMQSYANAGDFSAWGKVKRAVYENALFYGSYLLIFGLLIVYVAAKGISIDFANLKTIGITASNTWGLLLLVFLLGYGLVEIPRQIWNAGTKGYRLQKVYFDIEKLSSEKNDAEESVKEAFRDVEEEMRGLRSGHPFRERVEVIRAKFPADVAEQLSGRRGRGDSASADSLRDSDAANLGPASEKGETDLQALVRLHRRVIVSLQSLHRTRAHWKALVEHAMHMEEVMKNENMPSGGSREFVRTYVVNRSALQVAVCSPTVEWYWECRVKRPLFKLCGVLMALMTAFIVWSECTFFSSSPTLSLAAVFVHAAAVNNSYAYIELSSMVVLLYMCLCAYYTVFRLKFFSYYHLDPHGQTDANSLIFAAMLLCRLTPPLALNFLCMIHLDSHVATDDSGLQETAFTTLMGHLDLIPMVSKGINIYFPIAILLLCLGTYFKLGTRFLHELGIEQFLGEDEMTAEMVQGGKSLVQTERNRLGREANRAEREGYISALNKKGPREAEAGRAGLKGRGFPRAPDPEPYSDTAPIVPNMERSPSNYSATSNPSQPGIFDDL